MGQRKTSFTVRNILVFTGLSNAIIGIAASFYNSNLSWLLLISMPMLIAGIYSRRRKSLSGSIWHYWRAGEKKADNRQWLPGSIQGSKLPIKDLKVVIGNEQCSQPYRACIFNLGSIKDVQPKRTLPSQTIDKKQDFPDNSCEGQLHTYRLSNEDLALQVKPGYDDSGTVYGHIHKKTFRDLACPPQVKLVEVLVPVAIPSRQATAPIFGIEAGLSSNQPVGNLPRASYCSFRNAEGIIYFLDYLRELSGRKPTGLRLSITDKKEFRKICYAIRKTQQIPDFIVVEGPVEDATPVPEGEDICGTMRLYEALLFVSQTLQVYGLEKEIKIIASGEFTSSFEILKVLALGADLVCTCRYGMHGRKALPFYKDRQANELHNHLMKTIAQTMDVCGFRHVSDITLSSFFRKLDVLFKGSALPVFLLFLHMQ